MASLRAVDHTAVGRSDAELPAQEDAEKQQPRETPERRHVEVLLDISEEDFLNDLEPYESNCHSGWEEAVQGWARVGPLSCLILAHRRHRKPKHKEADNPTPRPAVDPALPRADSSSSIEERRCESRAGPCGNFKTSMALNQQVGSWSNAAGAALQPYASEWLHLNAGQKTASHHLLEEKTEEEGTLRETHHLSSECSLSDNRPTKPQKYSHRPNNKVVPIKNITFLPPIKSPHVKPKVGGQLWSGKTASEGETLEENCFMFDKANASGTTADPVASANLPSSSADLMSKHRTCLHNPQFFSALSVSIPKRYRVPSRTDAVHHRSYSLGKRLAQAHHLSAVAGAHAHMHPSCLFS